MIDQVLKMAGVSYVFGEYNNEIFFIFNSLEDVEKIEKVCPIQLLQKECDFKWGYANEYYICNQTGEILKYPN